MYPPLHFGRRFNGTRGDGVSRLTAPPTARLPNGDQYEGLFFEHKQHDHQVGPHGQACCADGEEGAY